MKPARIIVLIIAVVAGGIAALLAGRSDSPGPAPMAQIETVEVLVAGNDISVGSTVSEQDLRWQIWPTVSAGANLVRQDTRPDAISQLAGSIVRQAFAAGEPIREARLIKAQGSGYMAAILPKGKRAMSIEISAETSAGGFVLPNDHADVILSRTLKDGEKPGPNDARPSEILLTNIRVLAIDQTVEEKGGQRVVIGKTATLEVAPHQAEALAGAKMLGTLTLALRSVVDFESTDSDNDDTPDSRKGINVVRFGIGTVTTAK